MSGNISIFLLISVFAIYNSCRKPCLSPDNVQIENSPVMVYFNSFKPGNWWVYQNNTGTKTDSIYIKDFQASISHRFKNCVSDSSRIFKLIEKEFRRRNSGDTTVVLINSTQFDEIQFILQTFYSLQGTINNSAVYSFPDNDKYKNDPDKFIDSVILNNTVYKDVLVLNGPYPDKYFFAKNIGLVGWHAHNIIPFATYNLIKYKIN
ncbi:MAG: hypothetical protein K2Q24_07260 [Chitinophagaceae bacterium]|nr:hypothetical protein [Chitinophagaceae bacterium]